MMLFVSMLSGLHTAKQCYSSNVINLCFVLGGIQTMSWKPTYYIAISSRAIKAILKTEINCKVPSKYFHNQQTSVCYTKLPYFFQQRQSYECFCARVPLMKHSGIQDAEKELHGKFNHINTRQAKPFQSN